MKLILRGNRIKDDLYTGYLRYKEIDFAFVFDGEELRLTPPKGMEYHLPNLGRMECEPWN